MRRKLTEHIISVVFIAIFLGAIGYFITPSIETPQTSEHTDFLEKYIKPGDPLHKLMLEESLDLFYPDQNATNDSIVHIVSSGSDDIILIGNDQSLSLSKITQIIFMYLKFIIIYVLVLILTFYGAQSLAILKFTKMRQNRSSYLILLWNYIHSNNRKSFGTILSLLAKAIIKGFVFFILFSPAYVIAYSIKTRFDTDSFFFMILLGIISNGLLISYTQKFYTFIVSESRKGYVNTARVKNLNNRYETNRPDGIGYKQIFQLRKSFDKHVFQHIFKNARFQFISSIKEQASFLISGLVIIEMALNIQGHLCYELLQNILYKNFQIVLLIVFLIFLLLKVTELYSDYLHHHYSNKYDNNNF